LKVLSGDTKVSTHATGQHAAVVLFLGALFIISSIAPCVAQTVPASEEVLIAPGEIGRPGGRLVASLRADPKTLNPVTAVDLPSKEVIRLLFADLIHINLYTQRSEAALAKSWKVSPDGRRYTLELRRNILFSDGSPFDADDVVFSFKVYLDENVHSPQRDLLKVGGKPIQVRKIDSHRVVFELPEPYAAAERIFDGVRILPRHLLQQAYETGKISQVWNLATNPKDIAGLGPFRIKQYIAGQQIVLERNPFYWKADAKRNRLPYLDELAFIIVPTQDAEIIRFQAGDLDILDNISAEDYGLLEKEQEARRYRLFGLGAGFQYEFLFFNLNDLSGKQLPEISRKQQWFRREEFRQAISSAIDREAIARLVYHGRATPLWGQVTPGNYRWINSSIPHPAKSLERAAALLSSAGFKRRHDGRLIDSQGKPVEFSILTSPSNMQRTRMATIIQDDLNQLGMSVQLVPLEFGSILARVSDSFDYEASVLGLASGDADPNPEIGIWTSGGSTHLWAKSEPRPLPEWQAEIDRLMQQQTTLLDYRKRKQAYDRVQQLISQYNPVICLVSPNVLAGVKDSVGGVHPALMRPHLLWNAEQLFVRSPEPTNK
jgi:peptide/nickel transport system substrate-binding protein